MRPKNMYSIFFGGVMMVALIMTVVLLSATGFQGGVQAQDAAPTQDVGAALSTLSSRVSALESTVQSLEATLSATPTWVRCMFCINIFLVTPAPRSTVTPDIGLSPSPTPAGETSQMLFESSFDDGGSTWALGNGIEILKGELQFRNAVDTVLAFVPTPLDIPFQIAVDTRLSVTGGQAATATVLFGDIASQRYFRLHIHPPFIDVLQIRGDTEQFMQTLTLPELDWNQFHRLEVNVRTNQIAVSVDQMRLGFVQVDVVGNTLALGIVPSAANPTGHVFFDNLTVRSLES